MARHNPRCALCGAPTRPQSVGGVQSLVCVACGAATVDQRALEQLVQSRTPVPAAPVEPIRPSAPLADDLTLEEPVLDLAGLAALNDADFESELEHLREQRRRQLMLLAGMAALVLAFVVVTPALVLAAGAMFAASRVAPPEVPPMVAPLEPPEPSPAEVEPPEPPSPQPEVVPVPPPEPEPVPAAPDPIPPPAPRPDEGFAALVAAGWKVASREPQVGEGKFRQALAIRPGHADASYGLGYCLLKQGRLDEARAPLCSARSTADAEIRRDVDALLANSGLTCSP